MYELIILISKYLFLFYIITFMWQSLKIILTQKNITRSDIKTCASRQYIMIILFHVNSFLILSFNNETAYFDLNTLLVCFLWIILFTLANFVLKLTYPGGDKLMWNSIFFLCDIGLVTLQRLNPNLAHKQLLWLFLGFLIVFLMPFALNFIKDLSKLKYLYLVLSLVMILTTFFFGDTAGGAKNWLTIKNFTFQPSELIKILFILI